MQSRTAAPWIELTALGLTAAGLALIGLDALPLRDFDEGTVARVALELSLNMGEAPLLPTLWAEPYLNKAPGLHSLIAAVILAFRSVGEPPSEGVVRLAPALLSSLVVPLGGLLQWRLRPDDRGSALATAAILLTLLPIARHGRLAMLDGTQLSAMALLWLALASLNGKSHDRWWGLTAGLMSSAMLLLKAPLLLPSAAAAVLAVLWGQEWRQWRVNAALSGLLIGTLPGVAWHLWHGLVRGHQALWMWGGDGAGRVLLDAGEGSDLRWRVPLIELLEGGWPWLILLPPALLWAWRSRHYQWGRWCLATQLTLAAAILPLKTQLPWYSHPLWLPFALLCGPLLAWLVERNDRNRTLPFRSLWARIPLVWLTLALLLLAAATLGFSGQAPLLTPYRWLAAAAGLGWGLGGLWLRCRRADLRRRGVIAMVSGSVLALAVLFHSPLWLWELNESWPVLPVATLGRHSNGAPIQLQGHDERPSLNWYAGQRIQRLEERSSGWVLTTKPDPNCSIAVSDKRWSLVRCR